MTEGSRVFSVLVLLAALAILFFAQKHFYAVSLIVHAIVDIFAVGRSLTKVDAFFAYAAFLCGVALVAELRPTLRIWRAHTSLLLLGIAASFSYGLVLTIAFFSRWGFSLRDGIVVSHNGELSSLTLLHSHVMKGFAAVILDLLGLARQDNMDTGGAFLGLLPQAWYWAGAALVLLCFGLLTVKFVELYRARQPRHRALFILLYGVVSFCLLKNMIDGGVLSTETPIAIAGLLLILARWDRPPRRIPYWSVTVPLLAYGVAVLALDHLRYLSFPSIYPSAYRAATFAFLVMTLFLWVGRSKQQRVLLLLLTAVTACLLVPSLTAAIGTYLNARQFVGPDGVVVGLYHAPVPGLRQEWHEEERIGSLGIYTLRPERPTRLVDVLADNRLLSSYAPIQVPGSTCDLGSGLRLVDFTVTAAAPLSNGGAYHAYGRILRVAPIPFDAAGYRYRVTALLDPCAPRYLNILQELIGERVPEPFFLSSISAIYDRES